MKRLFAYIMCTLTCLVMGCLIVPVQSDYPPYQNPGWEGDTLVQGSVNWQSASFCGPTKSDYCIFLVQGPIELNYLAVGSKCEFGARMAIVDPAGRFRDAWVILPGLVYDGLKVTIGENERVMMSMADHWKTNFACYVTWSGTR